MKHLASPLVCSMILAYFRARFKSVSYNLLPCYRHLPLLTRGKVYLSCVRSVMLHAAETWAMKVDTLNRHNYQAMIRWICNVRAKDEVCSDPF